MVHINTTEKVVIVGAGLVGSLMAIYLAKKGFNVEIYEKRDDMRVIDMSGGKSINLALSMRGIRPLEELGIKDEIMKIAIPMRGRLIHSLDGSIRFSPYGKDSHEFINSISRGELNKNLMTIAEKTGKVKIFFNHSCTDYDSKTGEIQIFNGKNNKNFSVKGQTILSAEGAGSSIRNSLQKIGRFNYSQDFLEHGYKELTIPPGSDNSFLIGNNGLHIWPRGKFMLIALPNPDGNFTATLFLPFSGENGFDDLNSDEKINKFFNQNFPDFVEIAPNFLEEFKTNPTGILGTIRCDPWYHEDNVLLIGDAAHAIVPFYGQGMNAGFEDCRVLNDLINQFGSDWNTIFPKFNKLRKINTDAIADLALENFIEMRDSVADEHFLLVKSAEIQLYNKFPEIKSKYSMVSFSHMPYNEAKIKGNILFEIVSEHCRNITSLEDFDSDKAYTDVKKRFETLTF
jgi:kynurenine 3-monooxygenase